MSAAEHGESPSLDLPPPVIETGNANNGESSSDIKPEIISQPSSPELASAPNNPVLSNPPVQQINFPTTADPLAGSTPVALTTTNIVAPATADDNDLIEKEWVIKAKKIVEANRDNPYNQSKEITVFKADYLKKRYNKTITINE